jgi:hypothetical protein
VEPTDRMGAQTHLCLKSILPICLAWGERGALGLVGLLATGADEIFHSLRRFGALSLLKFIYPVSDGIHHVVRRFARNFGFAFLPVHALSAFDDFNFLLRHNYKGDCFVIRINEITAGKFRPDFGLFSGKARLRRGGQDFGCRKFFVKFLLRTGL